MKGVKQTLRIWRDAAKAIRRARSYELAVSFSGRYLVATNKGILRISSRKAEFITTWSGFGIAIDGEHLYAIDESAPGISRIVRMEMHAALRSAYYLPLSASALPSLFDAPYKSTNGRIHQIAIDDAGRLLVAATEDNAIVIVNPETGTTERIYPFEQRGSDVNHINSVVAVGEDIFFVAYKFEGKSLVGYISGDRLHTWHSAPTGFHDLLPVTRDFLLCDTFGADESGRVMTRDGNLASDWFSDRSYATRGLAISNGETVIGHSHKGPRAKRFKGNGGLIRKTRDGLEYTQLPAAQVYQISRMDGHRFWTTPDELHAALSERFGNPRKSSLPISDNRKAPTPRTRYSPTASGI